MTNNRPTPHPPLGSLFPGLFANAKALNAKFAKIVRRRNPLPNSAKMPANHAIQRLAAQPNPFAASARILDRLANEAVKGCLRETLQFAIMVGLTILARIKGPAVVNSRLGRNLTGEGPNLRLKYTGAEQGAKHSSTSSLETVNLDLASLPQRGGYDLKEMLQRYRDQISKGPSEAHDPQGDLLFYNLVGNRKEPINVSVLYQKINDYARSIVGPGVTVEDLHHLQQRGLNKLGCRAESLVWQNPTKLELTEQVSGRLTAEEYGRSVETMRGIAERGYRKALAKCGPDACAQLSASKQRKYEARPLRLSSHAKLFTVVNNRHGHTARSDTRRQALLNQEMEAYLQRYQFDPAGPALGFTQEFAAKRAEFIAGKRLAGEKFPNGIPRKLLSKYMERCCSCLNGLAPCPGLTGSTLERIRTVMRHQSHTYASLGRLIGYRKDQMRDLLSGRYPERRSRSFEKRFWLKLSVHLRVPVPVLLDADDLALFLLRPFRETIVAQAQRATGQTRPETIRRLKLENWHKADRQAWEKYLEEKQPATDDGALPKTEPQKALKQTKKPHQKQSSAETRLAHLEWFFGHLRHHESIAEDIALWPLLASYPHLTRFVAEAVERRNGKFTAYLRKFLEVTQGLLSRFGPLRLTPVFSRHPLLPADATADWETYIEGVHAKVTTLIISARHFALDDPSAPRGMRTLSDLANTADLEEIYGRFFVGLEVMHRRARKREKLITGRDLVVYPLAIFLGMRPDTMAAIKLGKHVVYNEAAGHVGFTFTKEDVKNWFSVVLATGASVSFDQKDDKPGGFAFFAYLRAYLNDIRGALVAHGIKVGFTHDQDYVFLPLRYAGKTGQFGVKPKHLSERYKLLTGMILHCETDGLGLGVNRPINYALLMTEGHGALASVNLLNKTSTGIKHYSRLAHARLHQRAVVVVATQLCVPTPELDEAMKLTPELPASASQGADQ